MTVPAEFTEVLATVRDIAGQTQWWPGTLAADVLESDDQGRPLRAHLVNDVKVVKDDYEVTYANSDDGLSWQLDGRSKAQRDMAGSWRLVDRGGQTEATLELMIDTTLPLPGFIQRRVLADTLKGATEGLKNRWGG